MQPPDIVFLTDFGIADWYAAAMKGVAHAIAPGAGLLDLTHEIDPGDIAQADFVLAQAAPHFRPGTVFCVVVDPGVGSARRALACSDGQRFYVAPDNGVLSGMARAAGAHWRCHEASNPEWRRPVVSATFQGRDVFAPVAAWLTLKPDLALCGPPVADPVVLPEPLPERSSGRSWRGAVIYVDHFGNAITSFRIDRPPFSEVAPPYKGVTIELIDVRLSNIETTYSSAHPGEPLAYWGSGGHLEIAINAGDAAERFDIRVGDPVLLSLRASSAT